MSAPWDEDMVNLLKANLIEFAREAHIASLRWTPDRLEAVEQRLLSKVGDDDAALLLIHELSSGWTARRVRGIIKDIAQRRTGLDPRLEAMRAQNPEGVQIIEEAMKKGPVEEGWAAQVLGATSKTKPPKRSYLNSN
ncbi:MAG: hypothetical protein U1E34_09980 [Amaricoccus sp.]